MASKNLFNVLPKYDDDNVEEKKVKKQTHKERREADQVVRESVGDKVNKDNNYRQKNDRNRNPKRDDRRPRTQNDREDGSKPQGNRPQRQKREYERHSGTGRPAFKKNDYKKGGAGKGNVGNPVDEALDEIDKLKVRKGEEGQTFTSDDIFIRKVLKH